MTLIGSNERLFCNLLLSSTISPFKVGPFEFSLITEQKLLYKAGHRKL